MMPKTRPGLRNRSADRESDREADKAALLAAVCNQSLKCLGCKSK